MTTRWQLGDKLILFTDTGTYGHLYLPDHKPFDGSLMGFDDDEEWRFIVDTIGDNIVMINLIVIII